MHETFDSVFQNFIKELFCLDCNNFVIAPCYHEYMHYYDESRDKLMTLVRPEDRETAQKYLEDLSYGESMEIEYHRACMMTNTMRILKCLGTL